MNYFKRMSKVNIKGNIDNNIGINIKNYEEKQLAWYESYKKENENNNDPIKKNEEENNKTKYIIKPPYLDQYADCD